MRDVMVDLETLGDGPGCVILSIGAVAFDSQSLEIGRRFYDVIPLASSLRAGALTTQATLEWWKKQSREAQAVIFEALKPSHASMATVLDGFTDFLEREGPTDKVRLWANGSDFDNVLLIAAYGQVNRVVPWRFWNHRCFRTLKNLFPGHEPKREGDHHNALDDAVHQARWACAIEQARGQARTADAIIALAGEARQALSGFNAEAIIGLVEDARRRGIS